MKKYFVILLVLASFVAYSQTPLPTGFPVQKNLGRTEWGYVQSDSAHIIAVRDTLWLPRFPGSFILWQRPGIDTSFWYYTGQKWDKVTSQRSLNDTSTAIRTSVVSTANNGLTKNTGTNVQLGGELVQETTINLGSSDLILLAPNINYTNHYFKADGSVSLGVGSNARIGINNFTPTVALDARGNTLLRNTTSTFEFTGWPSSYAASVNNPVVGMFGLEPSLDVLIDSNSNLQRGGMTFRTLKASAPKLPSATFGANAGAKIEYNSFITGLEWTSTMEFYLGDRDNNTIHIFALSGPGTHFFGDRKVFTAESKEALWFGTAIRGVNSADLSGLSDTTYFAGDAGNKNLYIFNLPNIVSDTTNYKPMVYNPTTGVWARSTWPATGGGGGVTSVATNNGTGITGGTITVSGTLAIDTSGVISTKAWRKKGTDSLGALIDLKVNIADTVNMLLPYIRLAGFGLIKTGQAVRADTARGVGLPSYYYVDSLFATSGGGGSVNVRYSIEKGTGDSLQLKNDQSAPGFNMQYIANADSSKGWSKIQKDTAYVRHNIIQDTTGSNSSARATAGSAVEYPDGMILMAYVFYFGADIEDTDSSKIAIKRSYDGGSTWKNLNFLNVPAGKVSVYVPSLMVIGDTLYMMTQVVNSGAITSQAWLFKSADKGYTWDAGTEMTWTAGFQAPGANRLHRSRKSNRIFYPWSINTNGLLSSGNGNYYGKLSYSDDNMVTWTQSSLTIQPADSICIENGLFETNDSLIYYWRNRSGYILYIASGDDGNTWTIPSTIDINTANLGIQSPNTHSDIKRIGNDNLYVAIHSPVIGGLINNSADARLRLNVSVSSSGKPNSFNLLQRIKYDTTGGRTYGDATVNPLTDKLLVAYYVANRASTKYQFGASLFPLDKVDYIGSITDSLSSLMVDKKLRVGDSTIALFRPKMIFPLGGTDVGGVSIVNMPINGAQDFSTTVPGLLGRGNGRNTGIIIAGETNTNGALGAASNYDGAVVFDGWWRGGNELTNYDLVRFVVRGGTPYLRMIPTGTGTARVWFGQTALFGSTNVFDNTAELQVRDDNSYSILSVMNNVNSTVYGRIDFTKLRAGAAAQTNDVIGAITANALNNAMRFIASSLTNSVTGDKTTDIIFNLIRSDNNQAEIMRITSERLVGIGTQTPSDKLHIVGTLRATDTFKLPNIATKVLDTTNFKLVVVDASGNHFKMSWPTFGGGSGDTTMTKLPIYVITGTKDTIALRFGYGLTTATADTALIVDTSLIATQYDLTLISGATPGGADGNVQYKNGSSFAGEAAFTYTAANNSLYVDSLRTLRLQSPIILGGVATTSSVTYQTTTGAGTTGANHQFLVGNNGADTALILLNNKNIGINFSAPAYKMDSRNTTGVHAHYNYNFLDQGLYMGFTNGLYYHSWNSAYNGSTHTAKATSATSWAMFGSSQSWYANSGLTAGNTYTPTERMTLTTTGLGIGTISPSNLLHVETSAANTNTVVFPERLSHITSSTATTGFGVGIQSVLENASGTNVIVGNLSWLYTDATNASEDADLTFNLVQNGSLGERMRLTGNTGRLGVNTTGPDARVDILDGSNAQLRLSQADGTVYGDLQLNSNGILNITPTGRYVSTVTGSTSNRGYVSSVIWNEKTIASTSGTTETDLYSYTTPATTLGADGEWLEYEVEGLFDPASAGAGATKTLKFYWAGTEIFNKTTTATNATPFSATIKVIRISSTQVRAWCIVHSSGIVLGNTGNPNFTIVNTTFSNTNIIKVTGTTTDAGDQADVRIGTLKWHPAALPGT